MIQLDNLAEGVKKGVELNDSALENTNMPTIEVSEEAQVADTTTSASPSDPGPRLFKLVSAWSADQLISFMRSSGDLAETLKKLYAYLPPDYIEYYKSSNAPADIREQMLILESEFQAIREIRYVPLMNEDFASGFDDSEIIEDWENDPMQDYEESLAMSDADTTDSDETEDFAAELDFEEFEEDEDFDSSSEETSSEDTNSSDTFEFDDVENEGIQKSADIESPSSEEDFDDDFEVDFTEDDDEPQGVDASNSEASDFDEDFDFSDLEQGTSELDTVDQVNSVEGLTDDFEADVTDTETFDTNGFEFDDIADDTTEDEPEIYEDATEESESDTSVSEDGTFEVEADTYADEDEDFEVEAEDFEVEAEDFEVEPEDFEVEVEDFEVDELESDDEQESDGEQESVEAEDTSDLTDTFDFEEFSSEDEDAPTDTELDEPSDTTSDFDFNGFDFVEDTPEPTEQVTDATPSMDVAEQTTGFDFNSMFDENNISGIAEDTVMDTANADEFSFIDEEPPAPAVEPVMPQPTQTRKLSPAIAPKKNVIKPQIDTSDIDISNIPIKPSTSRKGEYLSEERATSRIKGLEIIADNIPNTHRRQANGSNPALPAGKSTALVVSDASSSQSRGVISSDSQKSGAGELYEEGWTLMTYLNKNKANKAAKHIDVVSKYYPMAQILQGETMGKYTISKGYLRK